MRKRLILGGACLISAVVVFLFGYTEITFSIRDDYASNAAIFPAAFLALFGLAHIIKVVRFKFNW